MNAPPPRRKLPSSPTGYRVIEESPPPQVESAPPPGEVSFRGNGWKLNFPMALVIAVVSGFGARMFPGQSAPEADARAEARLEAQRNSEFRQEMRETLRQLEARLSRQEDALHNYRSILEERLKRIEAK